MAAGIPFMEVTGRKDVQNGGRSILKMTTAFGLFSSLSKGKIYFFLLFTSDLSYLNSFKLPYKIRLLAFCDDIPFVLHELCSPHEVCSPDQSVFSFIKVVFT